METLTLQAVKKFLLICNAPFSVLSSSCYALEESMPLPFTMVVGETLMTSRQPPVEVISTKAAYLEEGDAPPLSGTQCINTGIGKGSMCFGNNRPTRIRLLPDQSLRLELSPQSISQRKYNVSFPPPIPEPLPGQVILPEFDLGARLIVTTIQQGAERQYAITEAARQNKRLWLLRSFEEHKDGVAGEYAEEENETVEWWMSEEVLYGSDVIDGFDEVKIQYEDLVHEGMSLKPDTRYGITPPLHNKTRINSDVPCDGDSYSENSKNQATRAEDSDSEDGTSSDEQSDSDSKEEASSIADPDGIITNVEPGFAVAPKIAAYSDAIEWAPVKQGAESDDEMPIDPEIMVTTEKHSTTDDLVSPSSAKKGKFTGHLKTRIETVHKGKKINDNGKNIACMPNELVVKILSNLGIRDISVCKRVNRSWKELIDDSHLQARSFSLDCPPPAGLYGPQKAVERYHSSTRNWLTCFGDKGKELAERLGQLVMHKYFPEELFFSVAKVLAETKVFLCQNIRTIQHSDQMMAIFSPDGYHLVIDSLDRTSTIWGFVDGQWQEKDTIQHTHWVDSASFSPYGNHFVTTSRDHTAKIWRLVDGQWQEKATVQHTDWVSNASFSSDGYHLVTTSYDCTAKIWGLVDGQWQEKATIQHTDWVSRASFSPDGTHLVTVSYNYTAKIWELVNEQWREKATIQHTGPVNSASFSPDGYHLITGSRDHTAKIWGLVDGQWQEKTTIQHINWVNNASFSPDGSYLVTASNDHTAKIWGLVDGQWQEKATIQHIGWVNNARFSPYGNHLVTASDDYTAKIWRLVDGQWQEKATVQHTDWVSNASFSSDGYHFVTTSYDGTAKIWGLVDGQWQEKATIQHTDWVSRASFSPDGYHLVTVSGFNTARIWILKSCNSLF